MEVKDIFRESLAHATRVIGQTAPDDFAKPTPDTEWTVRDLAAHMLYELSWTTDILEGKTMAEVGDKYDGDLIGDDLHTHWQDAATRALQALETVEPSAAVHLSYGNVTAEEYLWQAATDQLIHSWDLGEGIGQPTQFDPEVAQRIYGALLPQKDDLSASGLFAPPVDVLGTADIQTKLLALVGRRNSK